MTSKERIVGIHHFQHGRVDINISIIALTLNFMILYFFRNRGGEDNKGDGAIDTQKIFAPGKLLSSFVEFIFVLVDLDNEMNCT